MERLRTAAAALAMVGGVAGAIAVSGYAVIGCGDTSPSPTDDAGLDQSAEAASDVTQPPDTGGDAKDAGTDVALDRQMGVDGDSGPDVTLTDTGPGADAREAGIDADAGGPSLDASDAADAKVIPPGLLAYPSQYATAICTAFAACCGATFDVTACRKAFATQGYDNTLPQNPTTYGNGNLTFSQAQAAACVTALQTWPCSATITSAQNQAILSACHGVLGGMIPVGSTGCISSFECLNGYCNAGTCTALVGNAGACTTGESADHQCSYIATGLPARYCNLYPADGGASSGTGTCQSVQASGARCSDGVSAYSDYACTNQLCDFGNTAACVATSTNPAAPVTGFECGNFVIDAGGGG